MKEQNLILSHFGSVVKNLRLEQKISQEELAHRSGLHRTYITDVEHGSRNVSLESISKIARALGISITDLFSMIDRHSSSEAGALLVQLPGAAQKVNPIDILLIENEQDHQEVFLHTLRDWRVGNMVYAFGDGDEALRFLFSGKNEKFRDGRLPDLAFVELHLPKVDSLEILKKIREEKRTQHIPVVAITASADDEKLAQCKKFGVKECLTKPIGFTDLAGAMVQLGFQWLLSENTKMIAS